MKISGDKIELSELFTGLVLKSGKTKVEITERDGGFFIQFNGVEIRLVENNPVQIEPLGKKESDKKESGIEDYVEELTKMLKDKEKKDVIRDTIFKPAFMPTFTPYVPTIDPSRVTCDKLKTNILGGVNEL